MQSYSTLLFSIATLEVLKQNSHIKKYIHEL